MDLAPDRRAIADAAIADFTQKLYRVIGDIKECELLRQAVDANNKVHGYTQRYDEDGYVKHGDRNSEWRIVDGALQGSWEGIGEEMEHRNWEVLFAIASLPSSVAKDIINTVNQHAKKES